MPGGPRDLRASLIHSFSLIGLLRNGSRPQKLIECTTERRLPKSREALHRKPAPTRLSNRCRRWYDECTRAQPSGRQRFGACRVSPAGRVKSPAPHGFAVPGYPGAA